MIRSHLKFSRKISQRRKVGTYDVRSMTTFQYARAIVRGKQPEDLSLSYDVQAFWEEDRFDGWQLNIVRWKPRIRTTADDIDCLKKLHQ